jgi:hypothetical protein
MRSSIRSAGSPVRIALLALVVLSAVVSVQSSSARTRGEVSVAAACTRNVSVFILVYQFFSQPVGNGCWGYNRIYQNAGQGANNWKLCYGDGTSQGAGPNRAFDETSPANALSTETSRINACGSPSNIIYMAKRPQNAENWCSSRGYGTSCWRRNAGSVTVKRFAAEVYSSESRTEDLYSTWTATGSGASPSNSIATYNIHPIIFNATGTTSSLYNAVYRWCRQTPHGGFMSIYSGSTLSGPATTQTDVNTFSSAMSACTTQ